MSVSHLEVSRQFNASPDAVFALISDITRTGEWSPECHTCEWTGDSTGPELGATFVGHNRSADGTKEWSIDCKVSEYEPNSLFTFQCFSRDFHFSTWSYRIAETDGGCEVTEVWDDLRPEAAKPRGKEISGVDDRAEFNRQSMQTTLDRMADAVE